MAYTQETKLLKLAIPFEGDERQRFEAVAADRCIVKGQLLRRLLLTWMDPTTGPMVEAAMRGRTVPDFSAGQAMELAEAIGGARP